MLYSHRVLTIGYDFKKGPMKNGIRKWLINFFYTFSVNINLFLSGCNSSLKHVDADYSEYLGKGYKDSFKKIKRTSTLVCNHVSYMDATVMIKEIRPALAPSAEFKNAPLVGTLIKVLDSIFIPRGGSEEKRAAALATIGDRQKIIEETGIYSPLLIFAEGATSNGSSILQFKKGSFFYERTM